MTHQPSIPVLYQRTALYCSVLCCAALRCVVQERDPVERVKKLLLSRDYDASAIKAIEKSVKKEVDTAVEESKVRTALPAVGLSSWHALYPLCVWGAGARGREGGGGKGAGGSQTEGGGGWGGGVVQRVADSHRQRVRDSHWLSTHNSAE